MRNENDFHMGDIPSKTSNRRSAFNEDPSRPGHSIYENRNSFWSHFNVNLFMQDKTVTSLSWVSFTFAVLSILINLGTLVAPGWGHTEEIRAGDSSNTPEGTMYGYYGIWYVCWSLINEHNDPSFQKAISCDLYADLREMPGWIYGVQVIEVLGLFSGVLAISALSAYIFSEKFNRSIPLSLIYSSLFAISAILCCLKCALFAGFFIYEVKWCCSGSMEIIRWYLYYCFFFACFNITTYASTSVCGFIDRQTLFIDERNEQYLKRVASTRRYH